MKNDPIHYQPFRRMKTELVKAARVAMSGSLCAGKGERILIITNPAFDTLGISEALYDAAVEAGSRPVLMVQPVKTQLDFAEPAVIAALHQADIVISMSHFKMGKDREAIKKPYEMEGRRIDNTFHYLLAKKTVRSFWSPGATLDMFMRTVPVDYRRMKEEVAFVKEAIDASVEIRVTSPGGTDVRIGVKGRKAKSDDGDFSAPGSGGNLPAGETFVSPVVGTTEGIIVFDGSISTYAEDCIVHDPVRVTVQNGFVVSAEGGKEAELLMESIRQGESNAEAFEREGKIPAGKGEEYKKNARNIGELGIGLNPEARITGNMLEDEKAYRTCHFAIGSNYDEDAPALIHLDCVVKDPTIVLVSGGGKERILLDRGRLER